MAKNVIILGAGASYSTGAPLMNEFLDVAERLKDNKFFDEDTPKIEAIFDSFEELHNLFAKFKLDINNIENFLGLLEMAKLLGTLGNYSDKEIDEIYNNFIALIVKTIENTVLFNGPDKSIKVSGNYYGLLSEIGKILGYENTSIITFNYDIALDYSLYDYKIHVDYCLTDNLKPENKSQHSIKLLKLHGSVNWGKCNKCSTIIPYSFKDYFSSNNKFHEVDKNLLPKIIDPSRLYMKGQITSDHKYWKLPFWNKFEALHQHHSHQNNEFLFQPAIVPPTWNKGSYHEPMKKVWGVAAKELTEAENIYIFGYSLPETDSFFKYLIALGCIGKARIKKFWVFDIEDKGVVFNKYRNFIGSTVEERFRYFNGAFEKTADGFDNRLNHQGFGYWDEF